VLYLRRLHQALYMLTESGMFLLILNEAIPSETGAYQPIRVSLWRDHLILLLVL
jgi:hypothetical protein